MGCYQLRVIGHVFQGEPGRFVKEMSFPSRTDRSAISKAKRFLTVYTPPRRAVVLLSVQGRPVWSPDGLPAAIRREKMPA